MLGVLAQAKNKSGLVQGSDLAESLLRMGLSVEDLDWTMNNLGISAEAGDTDSEEGGVSFQQFAEFLDGQVREPLVVPYASI